MLHIANRRIITPSSGLGYSPFMLSPNRVRYSPYFMNEQFGAPDSVVEPGGSYSMARIYDGVPKTIDDMRRMVKQSLLWEQNLPIRRLCEQITSRVRPKDYLSEMAALYYWVLSQTRYQRDPVHVEYAQSPLVLAQPTQYDRADGRRARTGDCEEIACLLASLSMDCGNPSEFVTISMKPDGGYHHVFVVSKLVGGGLNQRVVLDPVPGPPPNINRMLQNVRRWQSWPIEPVRLPTGDGRWGVAGDLSGALASGPSRLLHPGLDPNFSVPSLPALEGTGIPPQSLLPYWL